MAAAAVCRRLGKLGFGNNNASTIRRGFSSAHSHGFPLDRNLLNPVRGCRGNSDLVKETGNHVFLVDTLALARRLEARGLPLDQAEAITAVITEVLNDSLENVAQSVVSKTEMEKSELFNIRDACFNYLSIYVRQEHHFSLLQREAEKMQNDIDKTRTDLRHEIDKVNAGQRLDWNLEKGRIRDELTQQKADTTHLENKLDRETHALRAQLEAAKYDVTKYFVATSFSLCAVGLAVVRIFL
ncbi:unnamed protein product [Linum tenue]|uniref:Uncharacterized protein n=1 Tax=Linum tenue TaxID=586396 RepID=A0AAV0I6E6_9ROSI|nr:unnamed protein product [Linum tenue]